MPASDVPATIAKLIADAFLAANQQQQMWVDCPKYEAKALEACSQVGWAYTTWHTPGHAHTRIQPCNSSFFLGLYAHMCRPHLAVPGPPCLTQRSYCCSPAGGGRHQLQTAGQGDLQRGAVRQWGEERRSGGRGVQAAAQLRRAAPSAVSGAAGGQAGRGSGGVASRGGGAGGADRGSAAGPAPAGGSLALHHPHAG